jgi:hypothetical protein
VPESLIPAASSSAENTPLIVPSLGACSCAEIYSYRAMTFESSENTELAGIMGLGTGVEDSE